MAALAVFVVVFAATALATRGVLGWLSKKEILDHPNDRSSHSQPTPRGGGLAVTPVFVVAWIGLAALGGGEPGLVLVAAGAAGLMAVSWLDDKAGLAAGWRLAAHLAAAELGLCALPAGHLVFQGVLPFALDRIAALLLWVWFVNLYNFMDGIDGITGIETLCLAAGLACLSSATGGAVEMTLAAAAAGFLLFNWHPAKLFLGDVGSVPLGHALAWLLLSLAAGGQWPAALILPAYYLTDATWTLARRAARGEKIWRAHREHFYQRAVQGGASHAAVARIVLAGDIALVGLALLSRTHRWLAMALAVLVVGAMLGWMTIRGRRPNAV